MLTFRDRLLGGLYGAVLGDACGVPYEFKSPHDIPLRKDITFLEPAPGFKKTYPDVPYGTWSDDTSLLLCLADALLGEHATAWTTKFANNLIDWRFEGKFAVGGKKFDIGVQTANAISELEAGVKVEDRDDPDAYGNGALMRSIVPSLCSSSEQVVEYLSRMHVRATHANDLCIVVSMVYSLMGYYLLHEDIPLFDALDKAMGYVRGLPEFSEAVNTLADGSSKKCAGTGYVVDSFWSAMVALTNGNDFKSTIQHAIAFGNDTDTTACIAGGLAGIIYGYDALPTDWLEHLRGKNTLHAFSNRMKDFHGTA